MKKETIQRQQLIPYSGTGVVAAAGVATSVPSPYAMEKTT